MEFSSYSQLDHKYSPAMGKLNKSKLSSPGGLISEVVDVFHANVRGAHSTSCHAHVHNLRDTVVHVTHTPHARLGDVGVLGQPVVDVVDVEAAGSTSEALHEGGDVELLQTRTSAGEGLTAT